MVYHTFAGENQGPLVFSLLLPPLRNEFCSLVPAVTPERPSGKTCDRSLVIAIRFSHAKAAGPLPDHHRDPFDRMLIAQTACENLTLITHDRALAAYAVATLWS